MRPNLRRLLWGLLILLSALGVALAYHHYVWSAAPDAFVFDRGGRHYELLQPRTIGVVLVLPLLLFVLGRSLADLPWPQRALSVALRLAFLALLGLALGRLVRTDDTHKICTVVMLDVSDSVTDEALEDGRAFATAALKAKRSDDLVKVIAFARRPRLVKLTDDGSVPDRALLRRSVAPDPASPEQAQKALAGSDLQAALELAYGVFPPGYLKRAVLVSDGVETRGDVLSEANRARAFGVRLFSVPYRRPAPAEVAVRSLTLPDKVDVGQPFDVVADVYSSRALHAHAQLFQGETLNGLDGARDLELKPGSNEVKFKSVVRVGGEVTYAFKLDRIEKDKFKENNAFTATLDVPGRPSVLYVEGQPGRSSYLASALGAQQFDVDVRAPSAFPGSIAELERYAFVVVSDVPKEQFGLASEQLVEKYVRDLGGGFLFAGGEAGYGLGGWAHTTIERILPVTMDAERRKETPSVAMVLVIDRSGSMTGLPIEMAKQACAATVGTLQGDDLLEVIAFDSTPVRYVKMQPARYSSRIKNDILRIQPGGGTEIFRSLDMAYQDISVVEARKKHVILLTDGNAPSEGIKDLVQAMLAESITVTAVGLGDQTNDDMLRMIAEVGGGRYHHVPDPNSLPKIFTREAELIARQAAVEDWFPVNQVGSADFLKGISIASAPYLHGYVATQMKGAPAQLLLQSDRSEPILARMHVGLGWTLAWTSDVKNLWAVDWLRWPEFGKFWAQLVREHMRQKHHREFDMKTEVVGEHVHAVVDALTPDDRFDNGMESKLYVTGPAPGGDQREVPMRQTAPGRYEASFELDRYGSFLLRAEHLKTDDSGQLHAVGSSFGHVSNPYPREYASFEPDRERLARFAAVGGGQVDPAAASLFDPGAEKITYNRDLWSRFVLAALGVFVLDLLVRRVRLFDRKALPKRHTVRARA